MVGAQAAAKDTESVMPHEPSEHEIQSAVRKSLFGGAPVVQINATTNEVVAIYPTHTAAMKAVAFRARSTWLQKAVETGAIVRGFIFRLASEEEKASLHYNRPNCRPIQQLDQSGAVIREFVSLPEAARAVHVSKSTLQRAVNGRKLTGAGHLWRYKKVGNNGVERTRPEALGHSQNDNCFPIRTSPPMRRA